MPEITTTANGHKIEQSIPVLTAVEFQDRLASEYGIDGDTPAERIQQLKQLSVVRASIMIDDINRSIQGSVDSLVSHDEAIPVGGKQTVPPEDRYGVFSRLMEGIQNCPDDVSPERVADTLALGVVLLHPFHDGNGRTARVLGLVFREGYDSEEEYQADFDTVIEPRDRARGRGGFMINGYVPHLPEGFDRSDASQVSAYLFNLLREEAPGAYTSCYGPAPLHGPVE